MFAADLCQSDPSAGTPCLALLKHTAPYLKKKNKIKIKVGYVLKYPWSEELGQRVPEFLLLAWTWQELSPFHGAPIK